MKHHYWEAPIVIYLFLGGLGGGIMCLTAIMSLIVNPGTGSLFFVPMFFALAALAIGCFFLVFELLASVDNGDGNHQMGCNAPGHCHVRRHLLAARLSGCAAA